MDTAVKSELLAIQGVKRELGGNSWKLADDSDSDAESPPQGPDGPPVPATKAARTPRQPTGRKNVCELCGEVKTPTRHACMHVHMHSLNSIL